MKKFSILTCLWATNFYVEIPVLRLGPVLKADAKQARTIQKLLQPFAYGQMNSKSLQKDIKKVKDYLNAQ